MIYLELLQLYTENIVIIVLIITKMLDWTTGKQQFLDTHFKTYLSFYKFPL